MPEKVRILITAFDTDKKDFIYNVSKETVAAFAKRLHLLPENIEIVTHVFPIDFKATEEQLADLLEGIDFAISLGQHEGLHPDNPVVTYERQARNVKKESPDATEITIDPEGPDIRKGQYSAHLVPADGTPYAESDNAGRYLCNYTYYKTLDWMKAHGKGESALFLHLSWKNGQQPEMEAKNKPLFTEIYTGHVFQLALGAAGIVEAQRAARDRENPHFHKFDARAFETPDKTAIAAAQYQLVRLGLLTADHEGDTLIDGTLNPKTTEALDKLKCSPNSEGSIDLAKIMAETSAYEKRMQQAILQFNQPDPPAQEREADGDFRAAMPTPRSTGSAPRSIPYH